MPSTDMRTTKTLISLLLLASLLLPPAALAQQTLVVDAAHSQLGVPQGHAAPSYALKADTQLLVDASAYKFPPEAGPANSLQLIVARDAQYSVRWDPAHPSVVVSALTAHPNGDSKPFERFSVGQKVVVAIGRLEGSDFKVMWVGLGEVR